MNLSLKGKSKPAQNGDYTCNNGRKSQNATLFSAKLKIPTRCHAWAPAGFFPWVGKCIGVAKIFCGGTFFSNKVDDLFSHHPTK